MTTTTTSPQLVDVTADDGAPRLHLGHLLRSERIKMTSTKLWWLFGIAIIAATGLALLQNIGTAYADLTVPGADTSSSAVAQESANIFTSGQYFGGLFVMLFAILLITNEYHHQTATSTYLATPRRTFVVIGKFVAAMMAAATVWVVTTALDLAFGSIFFATTRFDAQFGAHVVQRAILINLLMFALWAVFGVGIGALLRSQIGATVTATLLYTVGVLATLLVFALLRRFVFHTDAIFQGMVAVPSVAAQVAEDATHVPIPGNHIPPWWVGALVMLGYGVVMAVVGTLILRKRDIS
ncbi:MAG TPA: ABC transporter permease [Micromonosporaceae bacterium]|jgi:ABC-type transport system involved in multi-copper enzyme maturation permease subunit|nr:ABC transporter permease [Micromonosporaceae bacterium]